MKEDVKTDEWICLYHPDPLEIPEKDEKSDIKLYLD